MGKYGIKPILILYFIMGYSFIIPYFVNQVNPYPIINKLLLLISFLILYTLYLIRPTFKMLNTGIVIILVYYIALFFSNMFNKSLNSIYLLSIVLSLGLGLLFSYCILNKREFLNLLAAIKTLIYIYAVLNLLLIFIFPEGIPSLIDERGKHNYLFGNVNTSIKFLLPGLLFSMLYDLIKFKKIRLISWLLLIVSWVTLIKTWAVTAMFGLFVFTVFILFKVERQKCYIYYLIMLFSSIIITVFLVFFKLESQFLSEILLIFEKDLTFSKRDILWRNSTELIKQSMFWGYGDLTNETMNYYIGNNHGSHNYYLDVLLRGGILSLGILLSGLLYLTKYIYKSNDSPIMYLLVGTSGAYFIMWVSEPFIPYEYLMFTIIFILISRSFILEQYYYKEDKN